MPATPSATSTIPKRHGRPKESLDHDGHVDAEMLGAGRARSRGRRVRILGQQRDHVLSAAVRGIDAGIGTHEAVRVRLMTRPRSMRSDLAPTRAARPRPGARRGPTRRRTRRPLGAARSCAGRPAGPPPWTRSSGSPPGRPRRAVRGRRRRPRARATHRRSGRARSSPGSTSGSAGSGTARDRGHALLAGAGDD